MRPPGRRVYSPDSLMIVHGADGKSTEVPLKDLLEDEEIYVKTVQFREYEVLKAVNGFEHLPALICASRNPDASWRVVMHNHGNQNFAQLPRGPRSSNSQGPFLPSRRTFRQQLYHAISRLHRRGYQHTDIHPRNIVWNEALHSLTLVDFGNIITPPTNTPDAEVDRWELKIYGPPSLN